MLKQYILIRTDDIFPLGKIMAHVGHNVLDFVTKKMILEQWKDYTKNVFLKWLFEHNQTKIVLNGGKLEDIEEIIKKADKIKIPTSFIEDIHIKKKIVAVIGPVDESQAKFLGLDKLRLYK